MCCFAMTLVDSWTFMLHHITDVLPHIPLLEICCFLSVTSGSHGKCRVHERINICGISCSRCEKEETCVYSCKGSFMGGYKLCRYMNFNFLHNLFLVYFSSCCKNANCKVCCRLLFQFVSLSSMDVGSTRGSK